MTQSVLRTLKMTSCNLLVDSTNAYRKKFRVEINITDCSDPEVKDFIETLKKIGYSWSNELADIMEGK